jgi:hypothetical protein
MLSPLLALALAAPARAGDCPDCKGDSRRPSLCAPHLEAERSALREQGSAYARASEPAERIAALEAVAALTREHDNAPSPLVARFLADGLKDESLFVRRRALGLLLEGQHRDETVRGVVEGWKEAQKSWRVLDAKLVLSEAPSEPGKGSVALTTEELAEVPRYVEAQIRALGALHDDRALTALATFLRSPLDRTPGRFLAAAAEALLELDSRRACETVIDLLGELESAFVEGAVPRRFGGESRLDLLATLKAPFENATTHDHAEIAAALARYAERKDIAPPSSSEPLRAADWKSWFKTARDALPDRIEPP